jgi:hypothetical protein
MNSTQSSELRSLVEKLREYDDPRHASREWKSALNLLRKCDLDQNRVANVVAGRNMKGLEELIEQLANDVKPRPLDSGTELPNEFTEEDLSSAMKAFRKRLKFTRLDDESQINNRNPLSRGQESRIDCIYPPFEWPKEVWQCLAKRGKLSYVGNGFYELGPQS